MQHSFTIAIDLDETLAGTFRKIFEYGTKKQGWTVPFEEAVIQHDWWKIPSLQLDEITAYQLFDEYFLSDPNDSFIPPIAGAKNGILELRKMGINSHIITARTESIRKKATRAWLARHMPEFDFDNQVHFTNHYELVGSRSK